MNNMTKRCFCQSYLTELKRRKSTVVIRSGTKKEPTSDDRLSKFDWHGLSPIFFAIMLLHNLKLF